jgi:type II secretory pathway component PulC
MRGDMLLKINNTELNKAEELAKVVRQHQGKQVEVEYERDGEKASTKVQINARN